jgi:hypothetical protein
MALEKLVQEVKYPCTYLKFGCKEVFAYDKLDEHQAECRYGQLTCPAARCISGTQCAWTGNYNEVQDHLMEKHLKMCFDYGKVELRALVDFFFNKWCGEFVFAYDEVFLRRFYCRDNMLYIVVQLQNWNMERKDLESRRQIGESEKGNAEE